MEQIDILGLAFLLLGFLVVVLGVWAFIAFTEPVEPETIPDDLPGRYEDYEMCERPYIEML